MTPPAPLASRVVRDQRGSITLEFAAAAVVLFTLLFGIMDFGRMIFAYNMVSSAARDGVRWASVRGSAGGHQATADDIKSYVSTRTLGLVPTTGVTVQTVTTAGTVSSWPTNDAPGSEVQITVQATFTPITPFVPSTLRTLSSTTLTLIRR